MALAVIGWLFVAAGVILMIVGVRRYRHPDQLLRAALVSQTGEGGHRLEEQLAADAEQEKSKAATP